MRINLFSILAFISFLISATVFFIVLQNRKSNLHNQWLRFIFAAAFWEFSAFQIGISQTGDRALFWWKIAHVGIIFLAIFLFHVVYEFCGLKKKRILFFIYAQGFFFLFFNFFTNFFLSGTRYVFSSFYYGTLGPFYHPFMIIWLLIVFYSHIELFMSYEKFQGVRRTQLKYFIASNLVGFSGGLTNFLPAYGIDIFPFYGCFSTALYCAIFTYAILKHRIMDIRLAITRTGIFILVYSFVLGIPFAMAFGLQKYLTAFFGPTWWIVPLITSTLLGTAGPFIYFFIQRKAEDTLLRDQKRYQTTLKQASAGMTRIKDLKKLLNMIVYILARTVNITHAFLYLYDAKSRDYALEATRGERASKESYYLNKKSSLISYLERVRAPIVFEEIRQQSQDYDSDELKDVQNELIMLGAAVAVPIFTEKRLLAIGILGKKKSGAMYTQDDLIVFSILANQVALAIENAQFYEESKQTQEQLFQAEKMATIGTMADGLSHQINNRLHTLGFIAGDALDTIKLSKEVQNPDKFQEILAEISKALVKIQDNVRQGGEIVQGLLRYTRKGEEGFGDVVLDKLVDEVIEMAQFKIKKEYVSIVKDYAQDQPLIRGNFTQLQEVLFNIIDNAYDAIMQKKSEMGDDHFMGKIKISTRQTEKFLEVSLLDNGMGVKDEDQIKLFTPFFTTKFFNKKGTGLGLYVIKKIVEDNHQGEVFISSEYKVGTLFVIRLPMGKQ